jgi:NTE family protein
MTTAFVLAGGGSLGAVEVGMLEALLEAGVHADLVVGASVGAINGAHFAACPDRAGVARLRALWAAVRRRDVFPFSPWSGALGMLSIRNHLVDPGPLRRLLARSLPYRELGETKIPFHVVATDLLSGSEVLLSEGPTIEAVMASSAIPGVFPPVAWDGRILVDGGVASNTPIAAAVGLGAQRVFVLPTGHACGLAAPPASAIGVALHGLSLLIARQLVDDVRRFESAVAIRIVPPPCPISRSPADFGRSEALVDAARAATRDWLARGGLDAEPAPATLAPHAHAM